MKQYTDLNEAAVIDPDLMLGDTEIWYSKPIFAVASDIKPNPENLAATHVLLGNVHMHDLETIFDTMQGERWSPNGEARKIIAGEGLNHTSMSVGDVVVINGVAHLCENAGWRQL